MLQLDCDTACSLPPVFLRYISRSHAILQFPQLAHHLDRIAFARGVSDTPSAPRIHHMRLYGSLPRFWRVEPHEHVPSLFVPDGRFARCAIIALGLTHQPA